MLMVDTGVGGGETTTVCYNKAVGDVFTSFHFLSLETDRQVITLRRYQVSGDFFLVLDE